MSQSLEDLSPATLEKLDADLDAHLERFGVRSFTETALNGLAKGYGGLMVARQIERNQAQLEISKGGNNG